ncbi:glycosyltransferase [Paraburkholderia nodosa]|uniref:glycosyltransferase n=1 Tax=Paraburkholderia nodosa TaxID=392320 RepID=UPI0004890BC5|nr:glycosyltransferase [Paraburkholderia nodosa]
MSAESIDVSDVVAHKTGSPTRVHGALLTPERKRVICIAIVVEAAGGGVAVHIADLIRGLRERGGFQIHLIAPAGARFDGLILNDEVLSLCDGAYRIKMERSIGVSDLFAFAQLFKCLSRINPDVVHSHSSKAGALARLCFGRWKQVYTPHAIYTLNPYLEKAQRCFYGLIERLLGRLRSDRIIAVSEDEAFHLQKTLRIPAERVTTIFNGVPVSDLMPAKEARAAIGVPQDAFVIGFVGRFDFQKGVDRLVKVARTLDQRNPGKIMFVAIGPGDFAAAAGTEAQSIPANLHVAGRIADARRYFSAFDLLVLPSRYEGFPYVLLEAVAARVPLVATMVSGAAELIEAERVGFVVPNEDDISLFCEAIEAMVLDAAMRAYMRGNCRRAVERFSVSRMVDRTVKLYDDLLKEPT